MTTFRDRRALITGASSGIGWSMAKILARDGCKVGLLARRAEPLALLQAEIRQAGGNAEVAVADVTQREATITALRDLTQKLGGVDLLIANAGVGAPTKLDPMNTTEIEYVFRTNLFGVIYALEAVLPTMLQQGHGHVAAVSSQAAFKGLPGESAYCASKAALNTYMEGLRLELRPKNIAVTTICPGFVLTPMTAQHPFKMPFVMQPDQAGELIVRALAKRAKVFRFPRRMSLLMSLTRWAPDWLVARVVGNYNTQHPQLRSPS